MWFKQNPEKILAQQDAKKIVRELIFGIKAGVPFEKLPRPKQVLVMVHRLRSETLNGTLEQYLANSSGDMFGDAVEALGEIGVSESQSILKAVGDWFPQGRPALERRERRDQIEKLRNDLGDRVFEEKVRRTTDDLAATFPRMLECLVAYLRDRVTELR